ncbi:GNAT family N-acetyltransferase [Acutalibacter muris]|uniref:N-acetyltransferase n=1 Tax=Acutalibacter muris TaxID=1796620 RepID=A0A1Z2XQJ9_9FIRM|nr:GNAT family N-acetyltransferase [Acutalibacter muris]ANU52637.1 N-acetyltransferase [Hungateiclostridiaceae bacterium KB18]ASB40696.1 N-acetyltransferase [Acutalibacter muris]QQR29973.1 GNAT family N-acetyltransferase [Acutalibacter muris]
MKTPTRKLCWRILQLSGAPITRLLLQLRRRAIIEEWTSEGHALYAIFSNGLEVGFLHMGSRGDACDWLEEVFVREDFRRQGIGSTAIEAAWAMLREKGLETMYLEVVPANEGAIRLYHRLGFTNLNTLTLNRSVKEKRQLGTQNIGGLEFRTYRPNNG